MPHEPRAEQTVEPESDRFKGFHLLKARMQAADADVSMDGTRWHQVDNDLTPDQYAEIPHARQGETRTTDDLWVKFRHPWLKKVVVARGSFDHDGGRWIARLTPKEAGDDLGRVVPIAWAQIADGEKPWDGPTIREHQGDPW
jgi:hypothetical protein